MSNVNYTIKLSLGSTPIFTENIYALIQSKGYSNTVEAEVIPKFSNKYRQTEKLELINKIHEKIIQMDNMNAHYFDKEINFDLMNKIFDVETELVNLKENRRQRNTLDFQTFTPLKQFLRSQGIKEADMNQAEYNEMTPETYKKILSGIKQNKEEIFTNLFPALAKNNQSKTDVNPFPVEKKQPQMDINQCFNIFKFMTNQPNIPFNHASYYLESTNYNVRESVEKFFQNSYQISELTLYYQYADNIFSRMGKNKKDFILHTFNFSDPVEELFNTVAKDFPRIGKVRIFTIANQEIFPYKYAIGVLKLLNRSALKIII